ncbi:PEGA domain-containing protein [bacterium]|nr:PEGA domain-containing protein [bacterium]
MRNHFFKKIIIVLAMTLLTGLFLLLAWRPTPVTYLSIQSNIKGAMIMIDDHLTEHTTPAVITDLAKGKHKIGLLTMQNLNQALEQEFEIIEGRQNHVYMYYDLFENRSTELLVQSNITGAEIFVDETVTAYKTPALIKDVQPGKRKVKLAYGDQLVEQEIEIMPGQRNQMFLFYGNGISGIADLAIASNLHGADVLIDGRETPFQTPAIIDGVQVGEHAVTLRYQGRYAHFRVHVKEGKHNHVDLDVPLADANIFTNVDGAEILIDGETTGSTAPEQIKGLIEGEYKIALKKNERIVFKKIFVSADSRNDVRIDFPLGHVQIESNVKGAEIWFDGHVTGLKTPHTIQDLMEGEHTILLKKNHHTVDGKVMIAADAVHVASFDFPVGTLLVKTNVQDAEIFINKEKKDMKAPFELSEIFEGRHSVRLVKDNQVLEKTIDVKAFAQNILEMNYSFGSLRIESNLQNASIFLNGKTFGKTTPAFLTQVVAGKHQIQIEKDGFTIGKEVVVEADSIQNVIMNLDMNAMGQITVRSNIPGWPVFINGKNTRTVTPAVLDNLKPGEYVVTVEKGNRRFESKLVLSPNQNKLVDFTFPLGDLLIKSNVQDAAITINDEKVNQKTPSIIKNLIADTYEIIVSANDQKIKKIVAIKPHVENVAEFEFTQEKNGNGKKWYYILGTAAAVAGAASIIKGKGKNGDVSGIPALPLPTE